MKVLEGAAILWKIRGSCFEDVLVAIFSSSLRKTSASPASKPYCLNVGTKSPALFTSACSRIEVVNIGVVVASSSSCWTAFLLRSCIWEVREREATELPGVSTAMSEFDRKLALEEPGEI